MKSAMLAGVMHEPWMADDREFDSAERAGRP